MGKQLSFTKYQHRILPKFRNQCNTAESTEDVRNFFSHSSTMLMQQVFRDDVQIKQGDIVLQPAGEPYFVVDQHLFTLDSFNRVWHDSDLPQLLAGLARSAVNRWKRLEKHPEKTRSKIRM